MAGWDKKNKNILSENALEDKILSLFNYYFPDSCRKCNIYKI